MCSALIGSPPGGLSHASASPSPLSVSLGRLANPQTGPQMDGFRNRPRCLGEPRGRCSTPQVLIRAPPQDCRGHWCDISRASRFGTSKPDETPARIGDEVAPNANRLSQPLQGIHGPSPRPSRAATAPGRAHSARVAGAMRAIPRSGCYDAAGFSRSVSFWWETLDASSRSAMIPLSAACSTLLHGLPR